MRARAVAGVIGLAATLFAGRAEACDRASSPLETPAAAVAVADAVVVAEVTQAAAGAATVRIGAVLKGAVHAGDTIVVRANIAGPDRGRCDGPGLEPAKRYLLSLWSPAGAIKDYHPVDEYGGVALYSPGAEKELRDALAQQHPHSPWQLSQTGIFAQLMLDPGPRDNKGDVDLVVVLRNTTARTLELDYTSWPRVTQSHCTLDLVNVATKQKVAPKDVPISKHDIEKYFSLHGHKYKLAIAPGQAHLFRLGQVTTAKAGWGYKEELGFLYYPIATPGSHTIAATCRNLFGRDSRYWTARSVSLRAEESNWRYNLRWWI
jgi:hypothetical protein